MVLYLEDLGLRDPWFKGTIGRIVVLMRLGSVEGVFFNMS